MLANSRFHNGSTPYWLILILCIQGLAACSGPTSPKEDRDLLIGQWNWVSTHGGIGQVTRTPESEGYAMTYTYRDDGVFELRLDGVLELQTAYTVTEADTLGWPGKPQVRYESDRPFYVTDQWIWSLDRDTLKLFDGHADGHDWTFAR